MERDSSPSLRLPQNDERILGMTVRCHCELDSQSQILGQAQNDKKMFGMTMEKDSSQAQNDKRGEK
ncbi:MAG: hypothetical protein LBH96_02315 [Candidatus Peribacteria bacterium]|jgi:hypothetical protein|nr:hypothetical protein [Candidatus Peribacteria bacterium]